MYTPEFAPASHLRAVARIADHPKWEKVFALLARLTGAIVGDMDAETVRIPLVVTKDDRDEAKEISEFLGEVMTECFPGSIVRVVEDAAVVTFEMTRTPVPS